MAEIQKSRGGRNGHRCMPGCTVSCSNIINDENGNYLTASLEYETIALNGSNLGIDSFIGKQSLALERAFNKGAGFTAKDDKLPDFMYSEAIPSTECTFDVTEEELAKVV